MASALSHAVAALGIGSCFFCRRVPKRVWAAGAICSMIPDVDVVGLRFGIPYGDFWGHRGITHSLVFAALFTSAVMLICFRHGAPGITRLALSAYLFLATASHGILDAFTNGGLGVAFFSPFKNERYFFPWRPILVSPLTVGRFFSQRGYLVLKSEVLWIWLPAALIATVALALRATTRNSEDKSAPR